VPSDEPGSTAIVVLTPEAEPVTGAWYRAQSNAGAEGMGPHITLLIPFVPAERLDDDVDSRLRHVLGSFEPFDYTLERLERFAGGVLYLAPEPAQPFVELVRTLTAEFPDYPPYDGAHDTIVPHGTVAFSEDSDLLERIAAAVAPHLPIASHTGEATIVERGVDLQWHPRAAFPLGARVRQQPGCR
jgi:2'-5' RNA ligase